MEEGGVAAVDMHLAFDAFFRKEFARIARAAAFVSCDRLIGPDIAQEAFARLFPRWSEMASQDHARKFVYRVAMNLAKSHRRRILRPRLTTSRIIEIAPDHAEASAAWVAVAEALKGLSARQRAAVILIDYADLPSAIVAELLGTKASTVRVHLTRGRAALRAALAIEKEETI